MIALGRSINHQCTFGIRPDAQPCIGRNLLCRNLAVQPETHSLKKGA
ncbi:hypothetical protein CP97_14698 [Aurantiacibacter atlanticus]|uniref:Uncharacterized protein n=1 Tax=Aurantiacibacter atlanticus TaxID=1648404 RepID=A0A161IG90_9SPHN|nr:hypothetical protein CP97_14698 [Aurantiacibacter atlanticus]